MNRIPCNVLFYPVILWVFMILMGCGSSRRTHSEPVNRTNVPDKTVNTPLTAEYSRKFGVTVPENANPVLLKTVSEWMGVPYKFGGNDKSGVDCSGLIHHIFPVVYNLQVPRVTVQLQQKSTPVNRNALKEGDLVFFKINTKEVGHAGIYLFNDYFVHASTSRGVIISKLDDIYWNKYFVGGGRFSN
ncbi:MAG: NlpC/P60 family protein [Chitinophagaceae bacterium]|nr:NlpC/P60 family protein [Chitinophagaceae bacterium]